MSELGHNTPTPGVRTDTVHVNVKVQALTRDWRAPAIYLIRDDAIPHSNPIPRDYSIKQCKARLKSESSRINLTFTATTVNKKNTND